MNKMNKSQGTPNWADCATTDLSAAERFYAALFGWASERITGSDGSVYSLQRLDGKTVAGIYELNQQMLSMGVPPHWGTYIEVDDVDATLEKVKAAGGSVADGPIDEPGVGRIAIIQDCVGAFVRLWHSADEHGAELLHVDGAMTWNELSTKEPERAARFYEQVFGVQAETVSGGGVNYTTLSVGGRPVAGILEMTPEMGDFPASWGVYFGAADVDAIQANAAAAGATVLREAFDVPGGSRMAVLQDPQGAVFEVIRMAMPSS
jgi:predicted enzyme related to lactoylglutathione lyase